MADVPGISVSLEGFPDLASAMRDVVDLQRARHGAVKIDFAFDKVDARANFGGFRGRQRVLVGHDIEQRGSAHLEFFLFRVEGLLIEVARLARRGQRDARLLQSDLRVVHVDGGVVHDLLVAGFVHAFVQERRDVVGLRRAIANRNRQADLRVVFRIDAGKHVAQGRRQAGTRSAAAGVHGVGVQVGVRLPAKSFRGIFAGQRQNREQRILAWRAR